MGSIPESGRSPGGGHRNPLQYPCLENPMDRGAWQAMIHRVAKSQTRLSDSVHMHAWWLGGFVLHVTHSLLESSRLATTYCTQSNSKYTNNQFSHTNKFKASACCTSINISLTKTKHMAETKLSLRKSSYGMWDGYRYDHNRWYKNLGYMLRWLTYGI